MLGAKEGCVVRAEEERDEGDPLVALRTLGRGPEELLRDREDITRGVARVTSVKGSGQASVSSDGGAQHDDRLVGGRTG